MTDRSTPKRPGEQPPNFDASRLFGGMSYREMPSAWQVYSLDVLDKYIKRANTRVDARSDPAYKFLSFTNAGGIALMIGMVPSFLEHCISVQPLMLSAIVFTVGMVSQGLRLVVDLHLESRIGQRLIEGRRKVLKNTLIPDQVYDSYLQDRDGKLRRIFTLTPFRLIAFVCFLLGCTLAIGGIVSEVGLGEHIPKC